MPTPTLIGLSCVLGLVFMQPSQAVAQEPPEVVDMTATGVQQEDAPLPPQDNPPRRAAAVTSTDLTPDVAPDASRRSVASPATSVAGPTEQSGGVPEVQRPNVLSLSLLGFIGRFRLTYERMLAERHGLFGEAIMSPGALTGFDFIGYGASMGYRFHWRGPGRGPFVGGIVAVEYGSGKRQVRPNFREDDEYLYRGSGVLLTVALHAGYRWLFRRGFTIALRGGLGFSQAWMNPKPTAEPQATNYLDGPGAGIDGEASVGWAF